MTTPNRPPVHPCRRRPGGDGARQTERPWATRAPSCSHWRRERDMDWMSAWQHVIEEQRPSRSFEPPETYRRQVLKSAATTPVVAAAVRSSNSVVASDRGRVRRRTPLWRSAENPRALSVGLSAGASTRSSAGCRHRTKSCAHCRASGRAWCRRAARVFPAGTASPAVRARAG